MEIKISISDGSGTEVQYAPAAARSRETAPAAVPPGQAPQEPAPPQASAQVSDGLNAGAAPSELAAPGAPGAPMPFVEAADDSAEPQAGATSDDLSAGAAASR